MDRAFIIANETVRGVFEQAGNYRIGLPWLKHADDADFIGCK